jgi:hypothetical protein
MTFDENGICVLEPATFEAAVDVVLGELRATLIRKQHDYGPGNILDFGEYGVLVRANDKMARLKNLLKSGEAPANEAIDDTWGDLANYGIIALMVRRGLWGLPIEAHKAKLEGK